MIYKKTTVDDLLYLLACTLNNQEADLARVSKMNLAEIFSLAEYHKLAACVAFSIENLELDDEILKPWKQAKSMAIRKNILLNNEREQIYSYMENNSIRHASLKGIIMQHFYPKFGMREMSDNDILYDSAYQEKIHDFMIAHGYHGEIYKRSHHDEYLKSPIYNFEFHNSLFLRSQNKKIFEYYFNIFDRLIYAEDKKFELYFSDEDFYIYNIAHSYKHYDSCGTGLRILTDCYVYLLDKSKTLDFIYIENECEKMGIADYERTCRKLSQKLFSPESKTILDRNNFTEDEEKMFNRIINSGAYGMYNLNIESKVNKFAKSGRNTKFIKFRYCLKRIFVPLDFIRDSYPFFYRHKILIPILLIYRIFRVFTFDRDKLKKELNLVDNTIKTLK